MNIRIEPLETRIAPAFTVILSGTSATFIGDGAGDTFIIDVAGGLLQHNRATAGDAGFNSNFDFDTTFAGDQTLAASANANVTISAGSGNDSFQAGTAAHPASTVAGRFNFTGEGGDDTMTWEDSTDASARDVRIQGGILNQVFVPFNGASVGYGAATEHVNVNLGGAAAGTATLVTIAGTTAATAITVNGAQSGALDVSVTGGFDTLLGSLSLIGNIGHNSTIFADNSTNAAAHAYEITATQLKQDAAALFTFDIHFQKFTLLTGTLNDTIKDTGFKGLSIVDAGAGKNKITGADVAIDGKTVLFPDFDGDAAKLTTSKGAFGLADLTLFANPTFTGVQLQHINLSDDAAEFENADLAVTLVKAGPLGDGFVNLGAIDSTGHDLGKVSVKGDLGQLDAGESVTTPVAVKSLTVDSMGRFGLDTQPAGGSLESNLTGALGSFTVTRDVIGEFLNVTENIGPVKIGGSLVGGSVDFSGFIQSQNGTIGAVKIGGNLEAGSGASTGRIAALHQFLVATTSIASVTLGGSLVGGSITAFNKLGPVKIGHDMKGGSIFTSGDGIDSVTIGGSLIGGATANSGRIFGFDHLGPVKIGGNIQGGAGAYSGVIAGSRFNVAAVTVGGSVIGGAGPHSGAIGGGNASNFVIGDLTGGVTIGGSLIGGSGDDSGQILSVGDAGPIKIGHDLVGGSITGTAALAGSGSIVSAQGRLASVTIGGSVISGTDFSTGALTFSGAILAFDDIGSLTIKGSVVGHGGAGDFSPVTIIGGGQENPTPTTDLTIGKISIGGRVEFAQILAGYDIGFDIGNLAAIHQAPAPSNGNAQIGPVTVGGDWVASSLVAGVKNNNFPKFGDGADVAITAGIARIASITIGGHVAGTSAAVSSTDHFGFVSQQIGAFKAGGFKAILTSGLNGPIEFSLATGDVTLVEVA